MDTNVSFLIDAPRTLAEGTTTSRVQIAKTGTFKDPRYGKFSITRADFAKWMENFKVFSVADDRAGIPIDVDHSPEKAGTTEAAGWILSIDTKGKDGKSSTPDELWAVAEWNTLGVELVGDKRYRYLSPSYLHDKKTEAGVSLGTTMVGVGLTNRPFLQMATVSLSEAPLLAEPVADEPVVPAPSDSRRRMALSKNTLERLSLAEGATDEQIDAAIAAFEPAPAKTLDQLAGENGKVVLDAAEYGALKTGAAAGESAAAELKANKFTVAWDKALSDPKGARVAPAQLDNFKALYEANAEVTLKMLDELPSIAHGEVRGEPGTGAALAAGHAKDAEGDPIDEDAAAIDTRAQAILAEGKVTNYQDAVILAATERGA